MSLITFLETLLIGPLKLLFEIIFVIAYRLLGNNPGLSIIALSLLMNVMVLPLYRRADAMQEEARDIEAKLHDGVAHIKKTFSGDERMMILQAYYRQNNYKPTDALNGSASLLLEVPFFMAAYQFLSNLDMLDYVAFGPIANLGAPDGILVIGSVAINVLPILMTLVNVISSAIYLKGFPLKTKLQLYGMAGFFLVFLYNSPAGLVFYWTLNNVFSLVKNIVMRLPNGKKAGKIVLFAVGVAAVIFGTFIYHAISVKRKLLIAGAGIVMMLPQIWTLLQNRVTLPRVRMELRPNNKLFLLSSVFLTVLTGMLIPSTYLAASPLEFVDPANFHDPLLYILVTSCIAAGTFLVWLRVFHWLASDKGKAIFEKVIWVLCGIMLVNYMFFGTDLGILYSNLQYEGGVEFAFGEELLNLAVLLVVAIALLVLENKWEKSAVTILLTAVIALSGMSVLNMVSIRRETNNVTELIEEQKKRVPQFQLSKNGKNVVVIMMDRALGQTVPYIFNEKPELQAQFDGFVHYNNTASFGTSTIFGAPAIYGGYEYTPVEMNKRDGEVLVEKHNESLKVLPVLFAQNGYQATLINPVYANYAWIPDLSVFDDVPEVNVSLTTALPMDEYLTMVEINSNNRNFFCHSIMKTMPLALQQTIYAAGKYNSAENLFAANVTYGLSRAEGFDAEFLEEYAALESLSSIVEITDGDANTYMCIANSATHEPMLLQTPDYVPAATVDNTGYDLEHAGRFTVDGRTLKVNESIQMTHYHINMAAMIQLGKWFDYLRENDVYDNTRIIVVADHGWGLGMMDELMVDTGYGDKYDVSWFNPLLMVKDFNSTGFTTSGEFMTNADVPTLATAGLIDNPVNPFTGKPIDSSEKFAHDQIVFVSEEWETSAHTGTTFLPSTWASVKDSIWDSENWSFSDVQTTLKEHELP